MEFLARSEARKLVLGAPEFKQFFEQGYREIVSVNNPVLMNDPLVRPNDYWVNDGFAEHQDWFVAHCLEKSRYRVLRVIYVRPELRGHGLGSALLHEIQECIAASNEKFLNLAVRASRNPKYPMLRDFYGRHGFRPAPMPVLHSDGCNYVEYFWAPKDFVILQKGNWMRPVFV